VNSSRFFTLRGGFSKATLTSLFILFAFGACAKKPVEPGLVSTTALGTVRSYHFSRVITHFHTPYSFDACDSNGLDGNLQPNLSCLHDIKYALCANHINTTFVSDHVANLATTDYNSLLLAEAGDTPVVNGGGTTIANQINCADGFGAIMAPGLEGQLLALGMESHVMGDVNTRSNVYGGNTPVEKNILETQANAFVAVPHTESRDDATLQALASANPAKPLGIEIYNIHANLDPKIRKTSLGLPPFEDVAKFMNYLLDPFNDLNADYLFMEFLEFAPVYAIKWNKLLSAGNKVTGLGGCDSHENIFPQKGSDGERIDAHRRLTRFISNLVLTTGDDTNSLKASLMAGLVFFTVEGLGTPIGLDYHAESVNGGMTTITEMGDTLHTTGATSTSIVFHVPHVIESFPGMESDQKPEIRAELHFIASDSSETVVANSVGADSVLTYANPPAGNYRVNVFMIPHHLHDLIFEQELSDSTFQWIISNNILVAP
jgi:hypothetical protein